MAENEHDERAQVEADHASAEEEVALCPRCLAELPLMAHFCERCGAPISSYASTAPLEHVFSYGDGIDQAVNRPRKLITIAGLWLIFGPVALVLIFVGAEGAIEADGIGGWLAAGFWGLLGLTILALLVRAACRYHRHRQTAVPFDEDEADSSALR